MSMVRLQARKAAARVWFLGLSDKPLRSAAMILRVFLSVSRAQLLTYLRLGAWKAGLLINFNVPVLRDGMVRRVLALDEESD